MKKYDFDKDIKQAISDFEIIVPILESFGFTNIINLEEHNTDENFILDTMFGCDIKAKINGKETYISSRLQRTDKNYYSISLRDKRWTGSTTETEKRLNEIKNNTLKAEFTLQGFINKNNEVTSLAIVKTKELYWLLENKTNLFGYRKSDNYFYYINFEVYKKFKKILIYNKK